MQRTANAIEGRWKSTVALDSAQEYIEFPAKEKPVLLNAKEHVVGYLSKILNARVYDVAVETELQHAKNLSAVRNTSIETLSSFLMYS